MTMNRVTHDFALHKISSHLLDTDEYAVLAPIIHLSVLRCIVILHKHIIF